MGYFTIFHNYVKLSEGISGCRNLWETQYHEQLPWLGMVNIPLKNVMTWGWFMPVYQLGQGKFCSFHPVLFDGQNSRIPSIPRLISSNQSY
jgi:hypothetical protein